MLCAPETGVRADMALVGYLSIRNFRGIAKLDWAPRPGFNAIIGPGASAKSTVFEALDLVLGARRSAFNDADFISAHQCQVYPFIVARLGVGGIGASTIGVSGEVYKHNNIAQSPSGYAQGR
jgi:recombinational DNA repair ATPase RecF